MAKMPFVIDSHSSFSRAAFTLIEVMIAITIFSLVLTAIYSSWNLILRASRVSQTAAAQVQRQRVAIHTIEDALTCIQSFQASMKYYTFVVNDDPPELDFTARLPDNFPRNGKFGDLNVRQLQFTLDRRAGFGKGPGAAAEADSAGPGRGRTTAPARARALCADLQGRMLGHQPGGMDDGMGQHQFHPAADSRQTRAWRQQQ